jgi:hypothetical protein
MPTTLLNLLERNHGRAFANDRHPKLVHHHPMDHVTEMELVFTEEDYGRGRKEQTITGLLLTGDVPEGIGSPLEHAKDGVRFPIIASLMYRESPVRYRMRMLAIEILSDKAEAFQNALEKRRGEDRAAIIGTLMNIFVGRSEIDPPLMKYGWQAEHVEGPKTTFVFLHVNFQDNPGLGKKLHSDWRRLDETLVGAGAGIVKSVDRTYASFADLWPLFDPDPD